MSHFHINDGILKLFYISITIFLLWILGTNLHKKINSKFTKLFKAIDKMHPWKVE